MQDLAASTGFDTAVGIRLPEPFSDARSASVVVDDTIVVVLHVREHFADLVAGQVGDPSASTSAVPSLVADERDDVDALVTTAFSSGGHTWLPARADAARYTASFTDHDGHPWRVVWMDQLHVVD